MTITDIRNKILSAQSLTILTGAGVSADSGVPTFRGADGLWKNFRPEELASPDAFERDPKLVWEWYNWRRELLSTKKPNAAHDALVKLEEQTENFWLITQNVDGLHPAAGTTKLSEIHGNIWKVRCTNCGKVEYNHDVPIAILPHCGICQGLLRPHIVWFGESLAQEDLDQSFQALRQERAAPNYWDFWPWCIPPLPSRPLRKSMAHLSSRLNLDPTPSFRPRGCFNSRSRKRFSSSTRVDLALPLGTDRF